MESYSIYAFLGMVYLYFFGNIILWHYSIVWVHHNLFNQLPIDRHLDFCNKVALNISVEVLCLYMLFVSLGMADS